MKLITYEDYQIKISDEAFLIKPIRELWKADRTKGKEKFISQMSYLYFMVDPRSTYSYITDLVERSKVIIEQEGLPSNFKPSDLLSRAMDTYKEHTVTTSTLLLEDTRTAIDKVRKFLRNFDLESHENLDDKGKPIYTINQITATIKIILDLAKTVQEAEIKISKEIEEEGSTRGNIEKKVMEDGVNLQ